jgi:hypothetical protein
MGKVIDKSESPEAKADLNKENREIEDRKRDVTNALLSTLDLPVDKKTPGEVEEDKTPEKKEPEKKAAEKKESSDKKEPEVEEFESDKTDEEILAADDKDLNDKEREYKKQLRADDKDEELIPKSKVEKRFKQLTEEIRKLKEVNKPEETTDTDMARLEKMSPEKLTDLRQKIRHEIREGNRGIAKGDEIDEKRLDELDVLTDKVDEAIRTYPVRFQKTQVALYNKAAEEITVELAQELSDEELEKACPEIKGIAENIYSNYPKLGQSEEGQALALKLASDHWKAKREFSLGKSETDSLKQAHRRLLRKVTLDTNVIKGDKTRKNFDDMRKAAGSGGTDQDRRRFIKESPMFNVDALIPEEFKGR